MKSNRNCRIKKVEVFVVAAGDRPEHGEFLLCWKVGFRPRIARFYRRRNVEVFYNFTEKLEPDFYIRWADLAGQAAADKLAAIEAERDRVNKLTSKAQ